MQDTPNKHAKSKLINKVVSPCWNVFLSCYINCICMWWQICTTLYHAQNTQINIWLPKKIAQAILKSAALLATQFWIQRFLSQWHCCIGLCITWQCNSDNTYKYNAPLLRSGTKSQGSERRRWDRVTLAEQELWWDWREEQSCLNTCTLCSWHILSTVSKD